MILGDWFHDLAQTITQRHIVNFVIAISIFFIGIFVARRSRDAVERLPNLDIQQRVLLTRMAYYGLLGLAIAAAMSQMGFDLKVLLGAAGVLTVAIGFAAQTSGSNLISGIFLMVERPFTVGDVIAIGDIRGEVMSVDMLSSRIRTFNNLMVRIPNETLVKSNITNYSYFPIRRLDFNIGVGYGSDIDQVEAILMSVAEANPLCLDEPKPIFIFSGFGDSSMNIQFQIWTVSKNMAMLQNRMYRDIKLAFDQARIDIPFPTRTLLNPQQVSPSAPAPGPGAPRLS
jgi:small-conductance mechanosensitive channel